MSKPPETFHRDALAVVQRLSRAIVRAPRLEDVCTQILHEVMRLIPVASASIMQYEPRDRTLRIVAAVGVKAEIARTVRVPVGAGISGQVFASSQPLLVDDVRQVPGASRRRRYRGRSVMVAPVCSVPLTMEGHPLGVINMTDKCDGTPFTPQDLALLQTVADQAAAFMHLCALADEVARARQTAESLTVARDIQQGLLPRGKMHLAGLDVAGRCIPSANVGGDYFDVFPAPRTAPGVVIADVAGHHLGAALTMATVRALLRAEMAQAETALSTVLAHLNGQLFADLSRAEQFLSMVLVRYHAGTRQLRYASAGHPFPLLVRGGRTRVLRGAHGGVLGVSREECFPEATVTLQPGDVIVLLTDGVAGVENQRGEAFGEERIRRTVGRCAGQRAMDVMDALERALHVHAGGAAFRDDVTMVVLKVR
ncbi:MAG: SpoIIE family protein phosphatase [Deltaproteobacteria bacterium]|nr:SpoIIE family protein phosphatase [Deltaproteobacteria bacterium]